MVVVLGVAPTAGCRPGVACTLVGCDDGVSAVIEGDVLAEALGTVTVGMCADDACSERSFTADDARPGLYMTTGLGGNGAGDAVTVTVHVADDSGVLADHREVVTLETSQPNGPQCEPTCVGASVTVENPG